MLRPIHNQDQGHRTEISMEKRDAEIRMEMARQHLEKSQITRDAHLMQTKVQQGLESNSSKSGGKKTSSSPNTSKSKAKENPPKKAGGSQIVDRLA